MGRSLDGENVTVPTDRLQRLLSGPGRWRELVHLEEVGSTNEWLRRRALDGEPAGLVVVADHQTAGRGRLGRPWEDRPGTSLLMSCLATMPDRSPTLVPLAAGLATAEAVEQAGVVTALKWPNDVLIGDQKVAGILVEGVAGEGGPRQVIGIGLNLDWPGGERASVAAAVLRPVDRWEIVCELLESLDRWLTVVVADPEELRAAYRRRCVTLGREVRAIMADGVIAGRAEDIDDEGHLLLRTGERTIAVGAADVEHLRAV